MGCTQSKIDNEESVFRCKQRKLLMKEAVTSRNAFAAAHSSYVMLLKNTGAALHDYGQGESKEVHPVTATITTSVIEPLPEPPKPPSFLLESQTVPRIQDPLHRSVSMPPIAIQKAAEEAEKSSPQRKPRGGGGGGGGTIREDEAAEEEAAERESDDRPSAGARVQLQPPPRPPPDSNPPPPPPPAQSSAWEFFDYNMFNSYPPGPHDHSEIKQIEEDDEEDEEGGGGGVGTDLEADDHLDDDSDGHVTPVKTPEKVVEEQGHSDKVSEPPVVVKEELPLTVRPENPKKGAKGGNDLLQVLQEIDDQFLKASKSGQEVSKMLEANRLHYHSNFASNKGIIDPERVKRVITWNRSFRYPASEDGDDITKEEEKETHASVLDKLLAWEKKLYDEVKACELMKIEYHKKIAVLNRQKKRRGGNSESLEKTKAAVKYLHTRYNVDMQAMDSTSMEIQRLRDEQLYPCLVELVAGMAKMWKNMYENHRRQQEIVSDLRHLDISNAPEETSKQHHDRTVQLYNVVSEWQIQSGKLVNHQKEYISALYNWLRLNLIPIDGNSKEKERSSPKVLPHIHDLLQAWHSQLDKLPATVALEAIKSFAAVIKSIVDQQDDEMKQKQKHEELRAEFERKKKAFEEWYQRYREKKLSGENENEQMEANNKDPAVERETQINLLKARVEDEHIKYKKYCKHTRNMSLNSLKTGLPAVFQSMAGFARVCSDVYNDLHALTIGPKPMENGQ